MFKLSGWRNDFQIIYNCYISYSDIAEAINVDVNTVRQYASQRKTMPDNIQSLCS